MSTRRCSDIKFQGWKKLLKIIFLKSRILSFHYCSIVTKLALHYQHDQRLAAESDGIVKIYNLSEPSLRNIATPCNPGGIQNSNAVNLASRETLMEKFHNFEYRTLLMSVCLIS